MPQMGRTPAMLVGLDGNKSLSLSVDSKNITKHVSSPLLSTSPSSDDAKGGCRGVGYGLTKPSS